MGDQGRAQPGGGRVTPTASVRENVTARKTKVAERLRRVLQAGLPTAGVSLRGSEIREEADEAG